MDVQAELKNASGLESVMGILDQMTSFLGIQKYEENKKMVNIYIKPEEYSAYYVINDKFSGRVDLF